MCCRRCRLMGYGEDEAALRDAVLLTGAGDDPDPAGRLLLAFKRLAARKPGFSSKSVAALTGSSGLDWDDRLTAASDLPVPHVNPAAPRPLAQRTW
jgi:hypothetical protein